MGRTGAGAGDVEEVQIEYTSGSVRWDVVLDYVVRGNTKKGEK